MTTVIVYVAIIALGVLAVVAALRVNSRRQGEKRAAELEPVKRLAFEDITALGVELQDLDLELAGRPLDPGAQNDYQRALDAYETAKTAGDRIEAPDDIKHITEILEDGRYAMACVVARVEGRPLPIRRPPCFFDPRHGLSVTDVRWAPPGGTPREVPSCALDAERVTAGAEPDVRKVMVDNRRVPYWQGGPAYRPYAAGYFGAFGPMDWMFMGLMFGAFDGLGEGVGALAEGMGEGIGGLAEGVGEGIGGVFGGIGDMFDGFDF